MPRALTLDEVPEHWKAPMGPYRLAPDDFGGKWWLVTPFSDPKPWLAGTSRADSPGLPEGFENLFGLRPKWEDFLFLGQRALIVFEGAKVQWEQELKYFKAVARRPPGYEVARIFESVQVLKMWGLGEPTFYEGRFDWMGRFLTSGIPDYDSSAFQIINYPHHTVSQFQITDFNQNGETPAKWHPFVPPVIFDSKNRPAVDR